MFDGVGDSGQIETIDAYVGDATVDLPQEGIEIAIPASDDAALKREALSVREAIEELAYVLLQLTHGAWGDNEGAYGEFTFDVAARTIRPDYNERRLVSDHHEHSW